MEDPFIMQRLVWLIKPDLGSDEFGTRSELMLESLLSVCGAKQRQVRMDKRRCFSVLR